MTEQLIALGSLHESPSNYRRTFDEADLQELAASIKSEGILQPLLVRPHMPHPLITEHNPADGFEIVFGHRRFRSAQLAGLEAVRCMVRPMTDEQVKRAQIAENLQRKDVHAIEEAEGFQALIDEHNMTADMIAEQVGKSRSYVYGRLKLMALCREVRTACLAGEIGAEVGLLIARLRTEKLQAKALGYIRGKYLDMTDGGAKSFRHIRDLLNERFALELKSAMFDIEDEMLLSSAGNCVTCQKRSANAPEYADVAEDDDTSRHSRLRHTGPDICTDPDCFDAKKKAHLKREAAKLEEKGKTVVDGNKARAALDAYGKLKDGFVPLSDVREALKKAKDKKIETLHIQNQRTGQWVQAVKRDDLVAAGVRAEEVKKKAPKSSNDYAERYQAEARERERKAENETKARKLILERVRQRALAQDRSLFDLQVLAHNALESADTDVLDLVAEIHGVENWKVLDDRVDDMPAGSLSLLMLDLALCYQVEVDGYDLEYKRSPAAALMAAANHYGIDVDQVRAEVSGDVPTPPPAARAPTKAAKGKATAKAKKRPLKVSDADAPLEPELEEDQTDDAGSAGGRGGQVDAFADMELER